MTKRASGQDLDFASLPCWNIFSATWILTIIESCARRGHRAFAAVWNVSGRRYRRAHTWLVANQRTLATL